MAKNGQKWSKMAKNGQKWSKMTINGQKWWIFKENLVLFTSFMGFPCGAVRPPLNMKNSGFYVSGGLNSVQATLLDVRTRCLKF